MQQKGFKLGRETGSFQNWMMSHNNTIPEIGKGATELHWTDRTPYEVLDVSNGGKSALIRRYNVKASKTMQMGEQAWDLIPDTESEGIWVHWKWGAWRTKSERYYNTDKYWEDFEHNKNTMDIQDFKAWMTKHEDKSQYPEYFEYYMEWHKRNLIFGFAEHHYDWEF